MWHAARVTTISRTSVGFRVYRGRRYQKMTFLSKNKHLNVNKHFAALTAGRLGLLASCIMAWQACAINSATINSTGYVTGQSSYSRPTFGNGLLNINYSRSDIQLQSTV